MLIPTDNKTIYNLVFSPSLIFIKSFVHVVIRIQIAVLFHITLSAEKHEKAFISFLLFHLGIVGLWFLSKCFLVYVNCLRRLFTYHCQNLVFTGALYANVCFCVISKQTMGYYANGS